MLLFPSPTGLPSPPQTPSHTVHQYSWDSVNLTVQWQPPQYDGGAPVNYTITVSPGLSPVTTSGTSVPVTVPYNVIHTVSIVATNCNGSSSAAMVTIPSIGMYIVIVILPYSAKFSRDKIFADRPLTNFRGNKFRRSRIPVSHAQFSRPLNKLFTHSRSNAMLGCSLHAFG